MSSLVLYEKIKTTEEKAKAIKGQIEKLVTIAKRDGKMAMRSMSGYFSGEALRKLVSDVAPRFKKRSGGYTRIIKLGSRVSDNASMVLVEWTEERNQILNIKDQKDQANKERLNASAEINDSVGAGKTSKKSSKTNKKRVVSEAQKKSEILKKGKKKIK